MNSESKVCQNCKSKFTIEPQDFEFYEKVGVPAPTFCPDCRAQRRIAIRNEMNLYKRKCDFSGKEIVSIYQPDSPYKVYQSKIWHSDKWDPMDYGKEYDFNKPFFQQFYELSLMVPWPNKFFDINSVNCDYCSGTFNSKNCYMSIVNTGENCSYVHGGRLNNCHDVHWTIKGENCYENLDCTNNYNTFFAQYADNCIDSAFIYNCRNCQNCFGCINLRHKKYHIFNKPYSKKEYQEEIKKYDLGDFKILERIKKEFSQFKLRFPHRFAFIYMAHNCAGDNIRVAKNCHYCFNTGALKEKDGTEDCKYIIGGGGNLKDSYDLFDGGTNAELIYESVTCGINLRNVYFSMNIVNNVYDIEYSNNCRSSNNLFGCIGLKHKKHCILNKQYSKKEYEELVPKIKKHMNDMPYVDKKGRVYKYGEFFPIELSPLAYNQTTAYEYFPLTEGQALEQGYVWYNKSKPEYKPTIKAQDISDDIKDVDDRILKEIIECESKDCCGSGVFKLIPAELKFYKKYSIPIPRLCFECRHQQRVKLRNPFKLWERQCMKEGCNTKFQTTYSPERKEIVYCEACYQKEVE